MQWWQLNTFPVSTGSFLFQVKEKENLLTRYNRIEKKNKVHTVLYDTRVNLTNTCLYD